MQRYLFILSMTLLTSRAVFTQPIFNDFDDFLSENVVFGLVDYGLLKERPGQLGELVEKIGKYKLDTASKDHITAFYINAYNILVIKQIVDNYPIKSPMDVDGFFKRANFRVAGESISLDQIEFEKLIGRTNDPRIHFALGCGARSCPFLYSNAFFPKQLHEQLEFRARQIIEQPNYVFVEESERTVTVSKIFDWYQDQFESSAGSLIKYINQYKRKKVPEVFYVKFHEYDWSLNDQ
ncbi:MAG: hypothetical protein Tsb0034_10990 [Ekhidna sp.]